MNKKRQNNRGRWRTTCMQIEEGMEGRIEGEAQTEEEGRT